MSQVTHDDIDWASKLADMRRFDAIESSAVREVATKLVEQAPPGAVVVDAGCGAGGMSAALASALRGNGGGTLVLVDAVDELLRAAQDAAIAAGGDSVSVTTVTADVATEPLASRVPEADLVWASAMVHHLPNQQAGVVTLASMLGPGGMLALAEGGSPQQFLPWDTGVGRPGLEARLNAARDEWFGEMRAGIHGAVPMPYGWTTALTRAGLADATSFSYLVDHPAPASEAVRQHAVARFTWLADTVGDRLSPGDREAVAALIDPDDPRFLGSRDDVFLLYARTVHTGRRPR